MDRDAGEDLLEESLIGSGGKDVGPDLGPGSESSGVPRRGSGAVLGPLRKGVGAR